MDPTKSFDHLDPKLKETYARVMGTPTAGAGDPTQPPPGQGASVADPALSTSPSVFSPPPAGADPNQSVSGTSSLDPALSSTPNVGPNPGTGPTVSTIPADASPTFFSPPSTLPTTQETPQAAPNASPFFSNPTPAGADPTQQGGPMVAPTAEPEQTPVTPYSPENPQSAPISAPTEQYAQPLPSPSSVAQQGPHQASALLRVLYIIGAVVFFAIYTVFWIKVFNLPFLF